MSQVLKQFVFTYIKKTGGENLGQILESLIDEHYKEIYRYCYRLLRNKEDAEDLVQDVFIKVDKLIKYKSEENLHKNYIYKIAHNLAIDKIRKDRLFSKIKNEKLILSYKDKTEDIYFENQINHEVEAILNRLKPQDKSLFILRVVEEMEYDQISKIMDKNPSALRKQFERCREKIIKEIEREEFLNEEDSIYKRV